MYFLSGGLKKEKVFMYVITKVQSSKNHMQRPGKIQILVSSFKLYIKLHNTV